MPSEFITLQCPRHGDEFVHALVIAPPHPSVPMPGYAICCHCTRILAVETRGARLADHLEIFWLMVHGLGTPQGTRVGDRITLMTRAIKKRLERKERQPWAAK